MERLATWSPQKYRIIWITLSNWRIIAGLMSLCHTAASAVKAQEILKQCRAGSVGCTGCYRVYCTLPVHPVHSLYTGNRVVAGPANEWLPADTGATSRLLAVRNYLSCNLL